MKYQQLEAILTRSKNLLIFMHDYPDPDSITSAIILKSIASKFKVPVKIFYGGTITREENILMLDLLKIKLPLLDKKIIPKYEALAAVDFQNENTNHSIPSGIYPHLTFDHHPFIASKEKKKNFHEINPKMGSSATILLDYFFHFGIELTKTISTSFVYTILTETNNFSRHHSKKDILYYKKCMELADIEIVSKIQNTSKREEYFLTLKMALQKYKVKKGTLFCNVGEINNLELVQEVAEFFIKQEGVKTTVITAQKKGLNKISCRANQKHNHLGEILRTTLSDFGGSGGGHPMMAAGTFTGNAEKVIQAVCQKIK